MAWLSCRVISVFGVVCGLGTLGSACSRTGLEVDMAVAATGGGSAVAATGGSAGRGEPAIASKRWIAVPTQDSSGRAKVFGIRLGTSTVEDTLRLDPPEAVLGDAWGEFSRKGRGIAVSVSSAPNDAHAALLWDFAQTKPSPIELPKAPASLVNRFGPWLDEHRVVVMQVPPSEFNTAAEHCLIVDIDAPSSPVSINFDFGAARCGGYFAVSPSQKWLAALVRFDDTSQALLVGSVGPDAIGPFTRVADVPAGQTVAKIIFSPNDDYLALSNVVIDGALSLDLPVVALTNPPVAKPTFHVTTSQYLNFVQWAPTGSHFLVHTTRIDASMRGSNPIFVADAETGAFQEFTARYFNGSTPGLTTQGLGLITNAYDDGTASHATEWISTSDLSAPPTLSSRIGLGATGAPIGDGFLSADGTAFLGFSGAGLAWGASTQFTLNRFDFAPSATGIAQQTWPLSEYAPVRRWLPSRKTDLLVYHVAVSSTVFESADPLTQSHFTSEAGTYLLPLNGIEPQKLPVDWNSYQTMYWLPDASGLLRKGPAATPSVELDTTIDDGQLTLVDPSKPSSIFWITLDGAKPEVTDLTPYLEGSYPSSSNVEVADVWDTTD